MRRIMIGLLITLISSFIAYFVYETYFATKVFINPLEYAEFSRAVPAENVQCETQANIEYFYYKTIPDEIKANNKFGLYIYPDNEKFIDLADQLVNSDGGDWGYVLIPYNVRDKDRDKWNRVFFLLSKKHLIPIVQLYNLELSDWEEQTERAAEFLNSFNWPIKQRYVSVYNEPNDGNFWYGKIDPEGYAQILDHTINTFNKEHENFFMLNGAFNVSASNVGTTMDAFQYMSRMHAEVPGIFEKLDGWASHSYPQPNFSGNPYDVGRNSIRAYEVELQFLKDEFGIDKDLPVFITETGWAHDIGRNYNPTFLSLGKVGEYFEIAFEDVWLPDARVMAVTPFTVWYEPPADHFAFVDSRWVPYEHFQRIRELDKIAGTPEILTLESITSLGCP